MNCWAENDAAVQKFLELGCDQMGSFPAKKADPHCKPHEVGAPLGFLHEKVHGGAPDI
jgi:hypothetical protein